MMTMALESRANMVSVEESFPRIARMFFFFLFFFFAFSFFFIRCLLTAAVPPRPPISNYGHLQLGQGRLLFLKSDILCEMLT